MKFNLRIIFLIAFSIVFGCTTTDYVGKTYSKTDRVEIYFNKDEIERPYYIDKNMKLRKKGGSSHYSQLTTTTIVKDHVIDAKLLKYK